MKKLVLFLFCVCALASACTNSHANIDRTVDMTPRLISTSQTLSTAQIAETVKSAIVGIEAKLANSASIGSGVAVADGGYVLTNFHVVSGAKKITLYFADKSTGSAQFMWGDKALDLAVLKCAKNLPYLDTCPLAEVAIGEDVLAVGTPLSLQFQHTFTKGIVSALNRTIEIPSLGGFSTYMQNLIQHDASINSGNSGGPLINVQGKVIGINSLKASDAEGIGFAIPIETATAITTKLIPTGKFEQVQLGVFAQDAELAKEQDLTSCAQGAYVVSVLDGSVCQKAGIKVGDVIISMNGNAITGTFDLRKQILALEKGTNVNIVAFRGSEKLELEIAA